jgi:hypothetical protein
MADKLELYFMVLVFDETHQMDGFYLLEVGLLSDLVNSTP